MHVDKIAKGRKTTWQKRARVPTHTSKKPKDDKRELKKSMFMITINTNMSEDDPDIADNLAEKFAGVMDTMGYDGPRCELWGSFFRVATGQGRRWKDKKKTIPNPMFNPNYNLFYEQDDKQGEEHWCSLLECMKIESGGVEWAPGTKTGKNVYLHAHMLVKVLHRTRLHVNCDAIAEYVETKMRMSWKPYVHVDVVRDSTSKVIDYILKNAWNKDSIDKDRARDFFSDVC